MTKIYHYTKGKHIPSIFKAGEIKRERDVENGINTYLLQLYSFNTAPQVWFTTEKEMPFTATSIVMDEDGNMPFRQYQMQRDRGYDKWACHVNGVFRLAFDAEEIKAQRYWLGQVREQLLQYGRRSAFEKVAKQANDDIRSWYHCDKPVSLAFKKSIETWREGTWLEVNDNEALALCS